MDKRVIVVTGGKPASVIAYEVSDGQWYGDGWITPTLRIKIPELAKFKQIILRGYCNNISTRLRDNTLELTLGDQKQAYPLPWGGAFEISAKLPHPPSEQTFPAGISVSGFLQPDALDDRARAVILRQVTLVNTTG